MKTKITLLALLFTLLGFAQNGINYKAVIKDNLGNVVANQSISIQFTILKGTTNVYKETHLPTTDANGIAIVNIGEGTIVSGTFAAIDWGNNNHFLKVEIDSAGGTAFIDMGTTEFKSVPYALNVTGLERIIEGGVKGWRYKEQNPENYGNIGFSATDLSNSGGPSTINGATGPYAFATGYSTEASGHSSIAMGLNSKSLGDYSLSTGANTEAIGSYSSAIGFQTKAGSFASTAMGTYNIGLGDPLNWQETDPLVEIGNGTSGSPSNALTILKNGTVTAPSLTNTLIETAGPKALVTKEYVDASANASAANFFTNSNIQGFSNGTLFNLTFDGTNYNFGGGAYNNSTGQYTVPFTGVYNIHTSLNMNFVSSVSKSMIIGLRIYVNGFLQGTITIQAGATINSGYGQNFNYTSNLSLNANDVLSFKIIPVWGGGAPSPYINQFSSISITKVY